MLRNKKITCSVLAIFLFSIISSFLYFHTTFFRNIIEAYNCPFKALTKYPCASCGFTRCVLFVGSARFKDAFLANPFAFMIFVYLLAVLLINLAFIIRGSQRSLLWPFKTKPKTGAIILIILLILTWAYKLSISIYSA